MRQSFYSVPVRLARRRVSVRLYASRLEVFADGRVVATHARSLRKGSEDLVLDHYLEVLARKPGALAGSLALTQARSAGLFTEAHQRFWDEARRRLGDGAGTRTLCRVLLLHRSLPADVVTAGMEAALAASSVDGEAVAIEARAVADRRPPAAVVTLAAPRGPQRPAPYLAEVLTAEVDDRDARRRARRVVEARFPRLKRLAEFDCGPSPVAPATIATLAAGAWIDAGEPVVFLGDSGTGKTHLLIGTGMAACETGRRVRYVTCAQLVNELAEAADERTLSKVVARYGRFDLLCLDELGYVRVDDRGAELLFQVNTERDERASIAVGSNHHFSEWGRTFTDPRLAAAVVDRVTFRAHIIETGSDSYRLRASRAAKKGAAANKN